LLGTSSAGTETLKNLVLPAIGRFTIVSDAYVSERDFGNDFFVTRNDLGRPKAEVVAELMVEMNDDVKGSHINSSVDDFLGKNQ
jgi:amyloid beta precursor protein binding protein 1